MKTTREQPESAEQPDGIDPEIERALARFRKKFFEARKQSRSESTASQAVDRKPVRMPYKDD